MPDDRNNLEKLTLAVLSHLPTAVLYVHDLSGECGTSSYDQVKYSILLKLWWHVILQPSFSTWRDDKILIKRSLDADSISA